MDDTIRRCTPLQTWSLSNQSLSTTFYFLKSQVAQSTGLIEIYLKLENLASPSGFVLDPPLDHLALMIVMTMAMRFQGRSP